MIENRLDVRLVRLSMHHENSCLPKMNLAFFSDLAGNQCVKSVQIRSFFWSVFSGIQTEHGKIPHLD